MAEPLPVQPLPEIPKPESVVIGETPLHLKNPVSVGSETISSFTVLSKDQRATSGGGSAVILTKEPSRKKETRGQLVEKENLNFDRMDTKTWDEISGIRFRDEAGNAVDVPKEQLSLTPPSSAEASAKAEIPESPLSVSIVGLKAYEGRALDLADRSMQKLSRDIGTVIWKQSIGGIYFHERARQYYLDILKASETPFAEDAIRLAERRATDIYNKKLSDANFIVRTGTKFIEWAKDKIGMRTIIQTLALEEIGRMKAAGEIAGMETLEREATAVRKRFETDFDRADKLVRTTLGEKKLELLDETDARNAPIVTGIKDLMRRYATGEITDKQALDAEAKKFFAATLRGTRPDLVAEAELYTSSLFDAAENLRAKISHEAGIANIDAALAGIQVKLGLAQMGEVTSLDPTAVERGIGKVRAVFEWLNKKHIIVPMVLNEAVIGSGLALALSGFQFFRTLPFRMLGLATPLGAFGAGTLAGGVFAGWREYGQLHKDYLTHLREREAGAKFTETQKRRQWFERFAPQQRSAAEMTKTIEEAMQRGDYRTAMATIADLQARKAVSETGPKRIGLIQYSSRDVIESERAALDMAASSALGHLGNLGDLGDLLGGNTFPQFMEKLTVLQTRVLREGVQVLTTMEDPVHATLNLVSQYAPEANLLKRRWPFAAGTEVKAAGMDAILEEFKKEARLESVKYGVKAGAIGAAIGAAFQGVVELGHAGETLQATQATQTIGEQHLGATATAHVASTAPQPTPLSAIPPLGVEHITPAGPDIVIEGKDLGDGGIWDYFLNKTNNTATANGLKNLFRLYEYQNGTDNITFGPNDTNPYDHAIRLREATLGSAHGKIDVDLTHIPNDAHINLNESIFGDHAIGEFTKLNDAGIQRMNELIATGHIMGPNNVDNIIRGPGDAINYLYEFGTDDEKAQAIVLKLGYWGEDKYLPNNPEDLNLLYEKLGATMKTTIDRVPHGEAMAEAAFTQPAATPVSPVPTQPYPTEAPVIPPPVGPLNGEAMAEALFSQQTAVESTPPWFPVFIPYRSVLEAAPEAVVSETAPARERKPQNIAVREYLDGLSEEEKQFLAGLTLPPISPDLRTAVIIPVSQLHGTTITNRLESYLNQDTLHTTEFLVFDTVGVKEDVDKFLVEHPDMKVLYVAGPAYPAESAGTAGKIKRDATNIIMTRIATMPDDSPDVAIIMDNGTGGTIANTYLSSVINAFDQNPQVETVGGAYTLPQEAYESFPMLFAPQRAIQIMDALIRYAEGRSIPPSYAGNLAVRANALASVGGYKPDVPFGEDRVMAQTIGNGQTLPEMTATVDPKEISYATLQRLQLADDVPLAQNETYNNMSWQDMAKRASEAYTKEHLEAQLSQLYQVMPYDEYFKRTMDALGIQYELKDGNVKILSTDNLAMNMAAPLDVEEFAKAETTAREHLQKLAGPASPAESAGTAGEGSAEETMASSLSSPDVASPISPQSPLSPQLESLPVGVEDRMATAIKEATAPEARVQLTPGELMDYLKSSIDIAGTRITEGNIEIDGTTVKLTDVVADVHRGAARLGDAKFSATLITDPDKGLTIDKQSFTMQLPWTLKIFSGQIHKQLDTINDVILTHINTKIDPAWQAQRLDVIGEKLEVTFAKKSSS